MMWSWARAFAAIEKRQMERAMAASSSTRHLKSVALVVGSNGVIGAALLDILSLPATPGGPWKVYALSRYEVDPPAWRGAIPITRLDVDLEEHAAVADALKPLADITHVFYVTWKRRLTEAETREANCAMLGNILSAVVPNCPALAHVCVQSSRKHCIDMFQSYGGASILKLLSYPEDFPPEEYPNLEKVLLDGLADRKGGGAVTWSVQRITTVFGFSPRSSRNIVGSLCAYAAICKREGVKMRWPGSRVAWEGFTDASDAELVAEHALWTAFEPSCKNETFNCSNGDVFKWKQLWPLVAYHFHVGWVGYVGEDKRFKLGEAMAGKEVVWEAIVREHRLACMELRDIASWFCLDSVINVEKQELDTINKSKDFGFLGFRNTVRSFDAWIWKLKADRIVPGIRFIDSA